MQCAIKNNAFILIWLALCLTPVMAPRLKAAESVADHPADLSARFHVRGYVVHGPLSVPAATLKAIFSRHIGASVALSEIAQAALEIQATNHALGYPEISVAIAPEHTGDIVALNVFRAAYPQIVAYGRRYPPGAENVVPAFSAGPSPLSSLTAPTNVTAATAPRAAAPLYKPATTPMTPAQYAAARAAMYAAWAKADAEAKDTRIHVASTNAGPHFTVEHYVVAGNTILTPAAIAATLTNIDGAFGTNVSLDGIKTAVTQLQGAYRQRGYVTVAVGLPQQKLTNATVKLQVTEGRLVSIEVKGNHYFSSNNVMRALPGLHTNMILNGLIFQAELNRANASQDRQIYPVIAPGPDPGTSDLTLKVKDRIPLHAKVTFNNESSPGTPALRLNTSAVYDNLWQEEHVLGVQYSFSPQDYKTVSSQFAPLEPAAHQWNFYDQPLVANYSTFYRLPLGNPEPVEKIIAANPNNFGYSEATRQFRLPPSSGQPDLTFFASRSTIDTGVQLLNQNVILDTGTNSIIQKNFQQDLTVNDDLGFRLNVPIRTTTEIQSSLSGGLDFKLYQSTSYKTNSFYLTSDEYDTVVSQFATNVSVDNSPVPATQNQVEYLPLALRYDGALRDAHGTTAFSLGMSANLWFISSTKFPDGTPNSTNLYGRASLQQTTGSSQTSGHWIILTPSLTRTYNFFTNWTTTVRADGQWASEPLISNEQFGIGGVNSVRGYREGEVFGDTGWHVSLEQQTAPYVVGTVYGTTPLTVRGSVYMDYARAYLLDSENRGPAMTALWGTGFGIMATMGSHWEARFLFSVPLLPSPTTPRDEAFFNFSLTAQF
jgi:hemolysin activation/secretion protein